MTLPAHTPFNVIALCESTTSIATTPVAMIFAAPCNGIIIGGSAVSNGTTTGTITVAVKVNGGSDIFGGTLTIAAGSGVANNGFVSLPETGTNAVYVSQGDLISATPSGGTGSTIGGAVTLLVAAL